MTNSTQSLTVAAKNAHLIMEYFRSQLIPINNSFHSSIHLSSHNYPIFQACNMKPTREMQSMWSLLFPPSFASPCRLHSPLKNTNKTLTQPEKMVVVVEILTGPLFHVRLPDGATVSDLKKEICAQEKQLPQDRLILILDGGQVMTNYLMMCENEVPLVEYGIGDGSHVYIFFTLPESADENDDHGSLISAAPLNTSS